jgi:Dolichyl-phosphate-mannose-protein mannosyltransferase
MPPVRILHPGAIVFLTSLLVYAACLNGVWATDHSTAFVQLDYALVTNHSIALGMVGTFQPHTVDDFVHGGMYYCSLAPGTPFLAVPFAWVGFSLAGGYSVFGIVLEMTELFVSIAGALAVYVMYRIARLFFRPSTSVLLAFVLAFSTISWPFATYFFQSDVSAMFVLIATYFALVTIRQKGERALPPLLCGLAIGAAFTVDYVNGILFPVYLLFLVISLARFRSSLLKVLGTYTPAALLGFVLIGLYNYSIFGNPLVTTEQAYLGKSVLEGFSYPLYEGLALNFISPLRGVFFYTPFLVLGVVAYIRRFKGPWPKRDLLFMLVVAMSIIVPYSAWYAPTGGLSFGPRLIMAAIPFLILPAGYAVENATRRRFALVYVLYLAGVVINGLAALVTSIPPELAPTSNPFLGNILPHFLMGVLDTWWIGSWGAYWWVPAFSILGVAAMIPGLTWRLLRKQEHLPSEAGVPNHSYATPELKNARTRAVDSNGF